MFPKYTVMLLGTLTALSVAQAHARRGDGDHDLEGISECAEECLEVNQCRDQYVIHCRILCLTLTSSRVAQAHLGLSMPL